MLKERDPVGRFIKSSGDEAEAAPEPELESEAPVQDFVVARYRAPAHMRRRSQWCDVREVW